MCRFSLYSTGTFVPAALTIARLTLVTLAIFSTTSGETAFAQASGSTTCKDGSKVEASVPGGACSVIKGVGVKCESGVSSAGGSCDGTCTSTGDGKCDIKQAATAPPKPGARPVVSTVTGVKTKADPAKIPGAASATKGVASKASEKASSQNLLAGQNQLLTNNPTKAGTVKDSAIQRLNTTNTPALTTTNSPTLMKR